MNEFDLDDIQFVDNTAAEGAEAKRLVAAELAHLRAQVATLDASVLRLMDEIEMRHGVNEDRWGILRAALAAATAAADDTAPSGRRG